MARSNPRTTVLQRFESACSHPPWHTVQGRIVGTRLARGRRPVAAALRQMGVHDATHVRLDPHGRNRARWTALEVRRCRLPLLVQTVGAVGGALPFVLDETVERRWGRCLSKRGHDRDPRASRQQRSIATSGLRWLVLTLVITPPWTRRSWAVPVLRVLAPTPEVSRRLGRRPKTGPQRARQIMLVVRRWWPATALTVMGAHTSSVRALGRAWARHAGRLMAPLRLDAAL
jgi:hypothetical protein